MKLLDFSNDTENFHVRSATLDGAPLFVFKDVCKAIGITKPRDAFARLDADEGCPVVVDTLGGKQTMACVTESGLYALIFMSRKPAARRFRRWVTSEVLPAIREHGFYSVFGSEEDAAKAKLAGRVAGQMSAIRRSVENLREPLPFNYGSVSAFLRSFDIRIESPSERLALYRACRAKAAECRAKVIPVWNPDSWRGVSCYPREVVRAALLEAGHRLHPDLFDNLLPSPCTTGELFPA